MMAGHSNNKEMQKNTRSLYKSAPFLGGEGGGKKKRRTFVWPICQFPSTISYDVSGAEFDDELLPHAIVLPNRRSGQRTSTPARRREKNIPPFCLPDEKSDPFRWQIAIGGRQRAAAQSTDDSIVNERAIYHTRRQLPFKTRISHLRVNGTMGRARFARFARPDRATSFSGTRRRL